MHLDRINRSFVMKMNLLEIAKAVNGDLNSKKYENVDVTGVSFDSRKLKPNDLFVPLTGKHDGHDFIASAIENGASATFWNKSRSEDAPKGFPVILVDDTLKVLQDLSSHYLNKINPKVVAITGSNGKTTTKDMIASILATQFNVCKTHANFNNEIGVPITILSMESNTEYLVVEMGMDRPGQLDFLSKLVKPDIAVITMIGEAHIEFFGTRDKIADAKMEITHGLRPDGVFVYDGDEPLLNERAKALDVEKLTFGRKDTNDIYPKDVFDGDHETTFKTNKLGNMKFTIPLIGDYNVNNALAAIEVGELAEILPANMRGALDHTNFTNNRTEWVKGANGEMILSDVYNSNPSALKAVLKAFQDTHLDGKRVAVLGDMLELGDHAQEMHEGISDAINPQLIQQVYLVGPLMKSLYKMLQKKYPNQNNLHYYATDQLDQLAKDLDSQLSTGDEVLLKGSHGIHLEQILKALE
ncbi:UDP-N-acetylmuramoylalanyl-D-glutamyl-2, 6-diaminopimelate D-alanyl-D-alanyl ligase [Fructilactobacillus fructivorans]|nr:UDP-N-acetylmuramoylalanyl-D-glutamyl-2, 6-diaminopimelate D-alanyl-D-alanyl ligase [Fructilactobacillus fructivorans]